MGPTLDAVESRKILPLPGIELTFPGYPAYRLIATLTELSWPMHSKNMYMQCAVERLLKKKENSS